MCLFTTSYCQSFTSPDQNTRLTKKKLRQLFSENVNICCRNSPVEWIALNNDSSSYYRSDTIMLYSDSHYYLNKNYCHLSSWIFSDYKTFRLLETKICQEPPLSTLSVANSGLNIRFSKNGRLIHLSIYKDKELRDKFVIVSLDHIKRTQDQYIYRLTLVRQRA